MNEQPTANSPQTMENTVPPVTRNNSFLVTLLSLLLLLAVATAGFFAYQTQSLVKELTDYKTTQTPTPTPTDSPSPVSDLKTYKNDKYSFEIKYSSDFEVLDDEKNLYGWPNAVVLFYKGGQSYDMAVEVWNSKAEYQSKYSDVSNLTIYKTEDGKYITLSNINKDFEVDELISSFKFIETSTKVSCTMDAKICPDGSSVGRIPPDCEFAPCPN